MATKAQRLTPSMYEIAEAHLDVTTVQVRDFR